MVVDPVDATVLVGIHHDPFCLVWAGHTPDTNMEEAQVQWAPEPLGIPRTTLVRRNSKGELYIVN